MNNKLNLNFRSFSKIKNNSNEKIENVFLKISENTITKINKKSILDNCLDIIDSSSSEDKIYILTNKLDLIKIKASLNEAINRGVTFYSVLKDGSVLSEYFGKILIRESSNLQNITIIIKEDSNGLHSIITHGDLISENFNYILNADTEQSKDLKRYFVNTFSNNSNFEFRKNEKKASKSLFENYLYNEILEGNLNINEKFQDIINNNTNIYSNYLPYINYNNLNNSSIQLEKKDLYDLEYIKNIGTRNNIFINSDKNLSPLFFTDDEGFYISDFQNSKNTFIISLNHSQIELLKEYELSLSRMPNYRYFNEIEVGKLNNHFFFLEDPNKEFIRKEKSIFELTPIKAENIKEYLDYDLDKHVNSLIKFDSSDIAHEYEYTIKIYPPSLPRKAKKDHLIKEWEKFSVDFNNLIDKEILNVKTHISNNNKFFFKLLKSESISKWEDGLKKLNEIKKRYAHSHNYEEIEKIFIDFKTIKENNNSNKNNNIKEIETAKKETVDKLTEVEEKILHLSEALENMEDLFEIDKKDILNKLSTNKNEEKILVELKEIKKLKDLTNISNNSYPRYINEFFNKYKNDYIELSTQISECLENKNAYHKEIKKIQTNINTVDNLPNSTYSIHLPEEALNSVGTLYEYDNLRYLLISDIKDLDIAFEEAYRLKAKIVTNSLN